MLLFYFVLDSLSYGFQNQLIQKYVFYHYLLNE